MSSLDTCIRCDEAPAVDLAGYCGHCHWAARAEVERGLGEIRQYLARWARFRSWEDRGGGRALESQASEDISELEGYLGANAELEAWCDANPHQADAVREALEDLRALRDAGELGT
jgi:hypothetical protein